ncbi:MAG: Uma2 family endonuclease [Gemmataceae bacterium]|nr:Uma2 family endonuclease [Gemmataceae bacterium]
MSTAVAEPVDPAARAEPAPSLLAGFAELMLKLPPGRSLSLSGVDWAGYEYVLAARDAAGRQTPRLFYCEGVLEAMTTGNLHERLKKALALLVESWLAETGRDYLPSGALTVRREDREQGFEPDECYYVQNRARVAGLRNLNFAVDPPPDLVIEVEVSRSAEPRLPVYAGLGVPEVWRYDGTRLTVLLLQPDGAYRESPAGRAIPDFPLAEVPRFLAMAASLETGYGVIDREFRAWVRSLPPTTPPG